MQNDAAISFDLNNHSFYLNNYEISKFRKFLIWLATSAPFAAKAAAWDPAQASGDGRRRPLVTLGEKFETSIMKLSSLSKTKIWRQCSKPSPSCGDNIGRNLTSLWKSFISQRFPNSHNTKFKASKVLAVDKASNVNGRYHEQKNYHSEIFF